MRMRKPSGGVSPEQALKAIKPEIRRMKGYTAPPQCRVLAKLNQNENPYDLPPALKQYILDKMAAAEWGRYPANDWPDLRLALAGRFGLEAGQVIVGNGSNQLLYTVAAALLVKGKKAVLAPPTFSLFGQIAALFRADVVEVPKNPDLTLDAGAFIRASRKADLIFMCSPDNPTGLSTSLEFLEAVLGETRGLVLWDEAYAEFWGKSAVPLIARHPNLLVLKTFSKAFGLAGLRLGYLMAHPALAAELRKVNIPYVVNLFSGTAALAMLAQPDFMHAQVRKIVEERERLFESLMKIPAVKPHPSEANFILVSVQDRAAVIQRLEEAGILVRDMSGQHLLDSCFRVTVGTPEENRMFIGKLREIVEAAGKSVDPGGQPSTFTRD